MRNDEKEERDGGCNKLELRYEGLRLRNGRKIRKRKNGKYVIATEWQDIVEIYKT